MGDPKGFLKVARAKGKERPVEEHVALTRSALGKRMLATWRKHRFAKVMPHEWRRALQQRAAKPAAKVAASNG